MTGVVGASIGGIVSASTILAMGILAGSSSSLAGRVSVVAGSKGTFVAGCVKVVISFILINGCLFDSDDYVLSALWSVNSVTLFCFLPNFILQSLSVLSIC